MVDCPNGYNEFFSETTKDPTQIMNVLATRATRRVASKMMEQVFGSIGGLAAISIIGWFYRLREAL